MTRFPQLQIAAKALCLAPIVSWRLKRRGVMAVIDTLTERETASSPLSTAEIVAVVDRAIDNPFSRRLFWIKCLERCVIQFLVLNRYGRRADLGFGIKRNSAELIGHAWLFAEGVCYSGDSARDDYTEMIRLSEWIARLKTVTPAG